MAFEFVPLDPSEQPSLIQFLLNTFQASPDLVSFRPEVIHWKYFRPNPDWVGPRSFVVKDKGQIVAHAGLWPIRLKTPERELTAINPIDWAARRSAVGSGIYLLRKIAALSDVIMTIGGSEDTRNLRNLLPKLGYKPKGEVRHYARVVRPWRHFLTTPHKTWKSPLKLVRNSIRNSSAIPPEPSGWRVEKIATFKGMDLGTFENTPSSAASLRTPDGWDHLLNCPAARFSGFVVRQREQLRGLFLLTTIGHQTRITDLRLNGGGADALQGMCNLAARTAAADPDTCELAVASSVPNLQQAWLNAGFVQRQTDQVLLYDPSKLILPEVPLNLCLADKDFCFSSDPSFPYLL